MDLKHNQLVRITSDDESGIYRVVVDDKRFGKTALVKLDPLPNDFSRGGRPRSATTKITKKAPAPLVGNLIWWERSDLEKLHAGHLLCMVELEPEAVYLSQIKSEHDQQLFSIRRKAMEPFLDLPHFTNSILAYGDTARLVREAMDISGMSRTVIYKWFSLLCRFGFSETSLRPRLDLCGAPGVRRPVGNGRKKAGAKTTKQRIARASGIDLEPEQQGVTEDWRQIVLALDSRIPTPKPRMKDRVAIIVNKGFVKKYTYRDGQFVEIELPKGSYPNRDQIRRILQTAQSRLKHLQDATTKGHFDRSKRGMHGKSWQGVEGPGHTWAIDSTVGDVYLRSALRLDWVVGRPTVYILVDVWSTAIVGFYICLNSPSWATAKLALFCSVADPNLIANLWGYTSHASLNPSPTLPNILLCDRGEYLSEASRKTVKTLEMDASYTPPYRPDLKGLVEVLHRIGKDELFFFTPGAIDQRRKELELRRFNPFDALLTIKDLAALLDVIFNQYNLSANRLNRLDAHMRAAGVLPTPSGLWRWGHEMGLGFQRATPFSELVTNLLPSAAARITRNGIMHGGQEYISKEIFDRQWTAEARNFGSREIEVNFFPGSVGQIWTPNVGDRGLLNLSISDQSAASKELTFFDVADGVAFEKAGRQDFEHEKMKIMVRARQECDDIIDRARKKIAAEEIGKKQPGQPSIKDARYFETILPASPTSHLVGKLPDNFCDEAAEAHNHLLQTLLEVQNYEQG